MMKETKQNKMMVSREQEFETVCREMRQKQRMSQFRDDGKFESFFYLSAIAALSVVSGTIIGECLCAGDVSNAQATKDVSVARQAVDLSEKQSSRHSDVRDWVMPEPMDKSKSESAASLFAPKVAVKRKPLPSERKQFQRGE